MKLTLTEAADYLGISSEDLMMSRNRGLAPGKLGFMRYDGQLRGTLYWSKSDLLPPPQHEMAPTNVCEECGFQAKSSGGLKTHQRSHAT